jgi:polysaccharide deacetylase family protein (PEP-CTERM system associated)
MGWFKMDANKFSFLFSIDLEDLRMRYPDGSMLFPDNLEELSDKFLNFLERHNIKTTFFTLGEVAKAYPQLIEKISSHGHEIAWHTYSHLPLNQMSAQSFREDYEKSAKYFKQAGISRLYGFRAPYFSLTKTCAWVYKVLSDCGFTYSSSILPAKNQRYAWPEFGSHFKKEEGIWELPMSTINLGYTSIPFAGGVYLRCIPFLLIRYLFNRNRKSNRPILSYIHPYDIDTSQKRQAFPDAHLNFINTYFLYLNRDQVFERLTKLIEENKPDVTTYRDYVSTLEIH